MSACRRPTLSLLLFVCTVALLFLIYSAPTLADDTDTDGDKASTDGGGGGGTGGDNTEGKTDGGTGTDATGGGDGGGGGGDGDTKSDGASPNGDANTTKDGTPPPAAGNGGGTSAKTVSGKGGQQKSGAPSPAASPVAATGGGPHPASISSQMPSALHGFNPAALSFMPAAPTTAAGMKLADAMERGSWSFTKLVSKTHAYYLKWEEEREGGNRDNHRKAMISVLREAVEHRPEHLRREQNGHNYQGEHEHERKQLRKIRVEVQRKLGELKLAQKGMQEEVDAFNERCLLALLVVGQHTHHDYEDQKNVLNFFSIRHLLHRDTIHPSNAVFKQLRRPGTGMNGLNSSPQAAPGGGVFVKPPPMQAPSQPQKPAKGKKAPVAKNAGAKAPPPAAG